MRISTRRSHKLVNLALMSVCLRIPSSTSFMMISQPSKHIGRSASSSSSGSRIRSRNYAVASHTHTRLIRLRPAIHRLSASSSSDIGVPSSPSGSSSASGNANGSLSEKGVVKSGQGFGPSTLTNAQVSTPQKKPKKQQASDGTLLPPRGNNLLIVGLGNPGDQYRMTRHNAGFLVAEELARRYGGSLKIKSAFQGEYCSVSLKGKSVGILRPVTYMNNSGQAARKVMNFFKLPVTAALILVDEVALDFGQLRLKTKGSPGGHNGLKSIQAHLKTSDYMRLRIGIGAAPSHAPLSDYVLGEFTRSEKKDLDNVVAEACDAVEHWIEEDDVQKVMTRSNGR